MERLQLGPKPAWIREFEEGVLLFGSTGGARRGRWTWEERASQLPPGDALAQAANQFRFDYLALLLRVISEEKTTKTKRSGTAASLLKRRRVPLVDSDGRRHAQYRTSVGYFSGSTGMKSNIDVTMLIADSAGAEERDAHLALLHAHQALLGAAHGSLRDLFDVHVHGVSFQLPRALEPLTEIFEGYGLSRAPKPLHLLRNDDPRDRLPWFMCMLRVAKYLPRLLGDGRDFDYRDRYRQEYVSYTLRQTLMATSASALPREIVSSRTRDQPQQQHLLGRILYHVDDPGNLAQPRRLAAYQALRRRAVRAPHALAPWAAYLSQDQFYTCSAFKIVVLGIRQAAPHEWLQCAWETLGLLCRQLLLRGGATDISACRYTSRIFKALRACAAQLDSRTAGSRRAVISRLARAASSALEGSSPVRARGACDSVREAFDTLTALTAPLLPPPPI